MLKTTLQYPSGSGKNIPAVILSGGSETVTVAVAEALLARDIPLIVISLGKPSLLAGIRPDVHCHIVPWPPDNMEAGAESLIRILEQVGAGQPCPWPAFGTEDGGLRLLMEGRSRLSGLLAIPGAESLRTGGLDKAELFSFLQANGATDYLPPTLILSDPAEAASALEQLGADAVFKPALKPFSMNLSRLGSKVITAYPGEPRNHIIRRLAEAWPISHNWIAQQRLRTSDKGEAVWWGFRSNFGNTFGLTASEIWKQPRIGGSGCWVEVMPNPQLHYAAQQILSALNFRGALEIPFLMDEKGNWKLLEMNPRPWLQVGLAEKAGYPVTLATYLDMLNETLKVEPHPTPITSWVNPERLLLAAASGNYGCRITAVFKSLGVLRKADCHAVWDTRLPKVRSRWMRRMLGRFATG